MTVTHLPAPALEPPPAELILGRSAALASLRAHLPELARADAPILIHGPSGAGKEALARCLHASSPRSGRAFLKVHCAGLGEPLTEAALGHPAAGDTLFLDEIAELSPSQQAGLLQMLGEAGPEAAVLGARLICSTSRDLKEQVRQGRFRSDLLYRINVVTLDLPPLRERRDDIAALTAHFLRQHSARPERGGERPPAPLSPSAMNLLLTHAWPGNIRELENTISRYVIVGSEAALAEGLVGSASSDATRPRVSLRAAARQASLAAQRQVILEALHANRWNRRLAARSLRISYRALLYKLRDTGIPGKRELAAYQSGGSL